MKIFRWSGLIGFVLVFGLSVVIGVFFLDNWLKSALENSASSVNGAEVNVGSLDLRLSPLGFELTGLQVTDPERLTHNRVVIEEASVDLNFPQLFLGRVRVNEFTVAGVQSNVERERPGERVVQEVSESEGSSVTEVARDVVADRTDQLLSSLPSVDEVVETGSSNTKRAIADAEETMAATKSRVESAADNVPGEAELAVYRQRVQAIEEQPFDSLADLQAARAQVGELTSQLAQDKLALEQLKREVRNAVNVANESVANIAAAPAQDWRAIQAANPFQPGAAMQVAKLLLGESLVQRIEQAQYWYGTAEPWLDRLSPSGQTESAAQVDRLAGEFVRFPHADPTPDFLLQTGLVSFVASGQPWRIDVSGVTGQQDITGQPIRFAVNRGSESDQDVSIDIEIDRRADRQLDTLRFGGEGIEFNSQQVSLAGSEVRWQPKPATLMGDVVINKGELSGTVTLAFEDNDFSVSGSSAVQRSIARAFDQVSTFSIDVAVSGTIRSPRFDVTSDIDNQLGSALNDIAKAEYDAWVASVEQQLNEEVAQLREPVDAALARLKREQQRIEDEIDAFEQNVVAEVAALEAKIDREIKALQDEAQAELDRLREQAEAERRAAEEAARKALEEKAKEELEGLQNKLNF